MVSSSTPPVPQTLATGATYLPESRETQVLVWAPLANRVEFVFADDREPALPLDPAGEGYWFVQAPVPPGTRYKFRLNGQDSFPDPASRFQQGGPHGWSEIIDPSAFRWTDQKWPGLRLADGQIIYEMHIGTFTQQGTWSAAAEKLPYLQSLGVTLLEVMPVNDFPGKFNWGYDGVLFFAPASVYGRPDDFRAFVDRAHQLEIGVLLDVVYNHLGPDGNYLAKFSADYFSEKHKTDWGPALNYDGPNAQPVRKLFADNAAYWIRDFHLDGLRFDATQDIHDSGPYPILRQLGEAARAAAGRRSIILIAENEPQHTRLVRSREQDGYGLDALWNDDFHHTANVALTGKADAYYSDYRGTPQEMISAAKYGYLYQGQWYRWQKQRRGTSTLGMPPTVMVNYIQNHDQIANSARGDRLHMLSSPGNLKAMTAFLLLMPGTPMLFQGQEFGASTPFLFFADHEPELAEKVRAGRRDFLKQWRSMVLPEIQRCLADPASQQTFDRCKLKDEERHAQNWYFQLHRDLIQLRQGDPVFRHGGLTGVDGAVLSPQAFVMRFFSDTYRDDRLLLINLGVDLEWNPSPEPLLAPPAGASWHKLWSSEDPQYGGCGTAVLDSDENWRIPGQAAVVLQPIPVSD